MRYDPEKVDRKEIARMRTLGQWPDSITDASVVDASWGITPVLAGILGLLPDNAQRLVAKLHRNWTPELVQQMRHEAVEMSPHSATTWWLALKSQETRTPGPVSSQYLEREITQITLLVGRDRRVRQARVMWEELTRIFDTSMGFPLGASIESIHGAYLAGHRLATYQEYANSYNIQQTFHLQTYLPSLNLWNLKLEHGALSQDGRSFTTVNYQELRQAVEISREYLGMA